ncbi:MAG: hypothetical protein IPP64_02315 [Bacteroidetes bacterium]|nr:hypothetical protein [Bacteroidota bacterium]
MKNLKTFITLVALFFGIGAFAQDNSKVIALVTKANWCPACKANGERMGKEVFSSYTNGDVKVIANDLTDDASKSTCKKEIEAAGIADVAKNSNSTGIITLIDAKTKKVITTISVTKSTEKIKAAIDESLKNL